MTLRLRRSAAPVKIIAHVTVVTEDEGVTVYDVPTFQWDESATVVHDQPFTVRLAALLSPGKLWGCTHQYYQIDATTT